jgi:hypothetical protein
MSFGGGNVSAFQPQKHALFQLTELNVVLSMNPNFLCIRLIVKYSFFSRRFLAHSLEDHARFLQYIKKCGVLRAASLLHKRVMHKTIA